MRGKRLLTTADVARMLDSEDDPWTSRRVRRRFRKAFEKVEGRWVTTVERIMEKYRVLADIVLKAESDDS